MCVMNHAQDVENEEETVEATTLSFGLMVGLIASPVGFTEMPAI